MEVDHRHCQARPYLQHQMITTTIIVITRLGRSRFQTLILISFKTTAFLRHLRHTLPWAAFLTSTCPSLPDLLVRTSYVGSQCMLIHQFSAYPRLVPRLLTEPALGSFSHRGFDQNWGTNTDADSFDRSEDPDDGLLGLGAIRERAHSSPGPIFPISSSPPVRIDVNPFQSGDLSPLYTDGDRVRGLPPDPRRNRSHIAKSSTSGGARPPLSGQSSQLAFLDSSFGSGANYGGRGSPGSTDYSSEYSHMAGGRSDMAERLQGRSRSLTAGSEPHLQDLNRSAHNEQFRPHNIDHTHKFGNLPALSNIPIQRLSHHQVLPPSRHIRSYSHSGTLQHVNGQEMPDDRRFVDQQGRVHHQRLHSDGGADHYYGGDDIYARGPQGNGMLPRSPSYNDHHPSHSALTTGLMQRSVSMSQAIPHHGFEGQMLQRRNTEFLGDAQYAAQTSRLQNFPSFHSRDEFVGSDGSGLLRQSQDELRSFGSQGYEDRSRNHHVAYQVPVRRHNEYNYSMLSEPLQTDSHRVSFAPCWIDVVCMFFPCLTLPSSRKEWR